MRTAAAVRVAAALSFALASYARAEDRTGAAAPAAKPATASAAAPQRRAAADPARRPPPAVIMIPLVGLVLLPLTIPVAEPRSRQTPQGDAQPAGASTGGDAAQKAPAPRVPARGDRVVASESAPCPACEAAPRQPADAGAQP